MRRANPHHHLGRSLARSHSAIGHLDPCPASTMNGRTTLFDRQFAACSFPLSRGLAAWRGAGWAFGGVALGSPLARSNTIPAPEPSTRPGRKTSERRCHIMMRNVLFRHLSPWERPRAIARAEKACCFSHVLLGFPSYHGHRDRRVQCPATTSGADAT